MPRKLWTVETLLERSQPGLNGCLECTLAKCGIGYACLSHDGVQYNAHRLMYMLYHKVTLTNAQVVRHDCDNPPCINPEHLIVGTTAQNNADMAIRGRLTRKLLGDEDVRAARRKWKSGQSIHSVAAEYGLRPSHMDRILKKQLYMYVGD